MIHITFERTVHFHGYWNKMVPFVKPSIIADLSNGAKFCNYTYWSTNDIRSHCLPCQFNNCHINNKDLILMSHMKISL